MSNLPKGDALEFQVSNFGPIVDATIELRPLTVFVGPSNTGKFLSCDPDLRAASILRRRMVRPSTFWRSLRDGPSLGHADGAPSNHRFP